VVVIGDSNVGKTNLITRFTSDTFNADSKATIAVDFGQAEVKLKDNATVKLQIWDTGTEIGFGDFPAGQERFKAITKGYQFSQFY
jgi:small GTP-binding protein